MYSAMDSPSKLNNSLNWLIGGAQGSGVDSAANIYSRACAQGGLYVFGNREYYSNIKGEHSYFTVRVSEKEIRSHVDEINMLVSFDAETLLRHAGAVTKDGGIICDSELVDKKIEEVPTLDDAFRDRLVSLLESNEKPLTVQGILDYASGNRANLFQVPYFQLLEEFSAKAKDQSLSKLSRMINVMSISISIALLGFEFEALRSAIKFVFRSKPKIAEINVSAAEFAYEYARDNYNSSLLGFSLTARDPVPDMILVQGNQSSALGKLSAGCKFQTYYPITPAADDSEYLEANARIPSLDGNEGSILVHMLDKAIANSVNTCRIFDQNKVHIDRGSFLENISIDSSRIEKYRRFRFTKDNSSYDEIVPISPRVPLGTENGIFWNTGDEHDEEGHITEDPNIRTIMMKKRMSKLQIALDEIDNEDKAILYGVRDSNAMTVISWGSTKGAILDAMDKLLQEGKMVRFVQIRLLHPFPSERVKALIDGYKPLVDIEMNYSSQLATLISENLSVEMDYLITKYNGRPMSSSEIYDALERINSSNAPRRIILERGA